MPRDLSLSRESADEIRAHAVVTEPDVEHARAIIRDRDGTTLIKRLLAAKRQQERA